MMMKKSRPIFNKGPLFRINDHIRVSEVRLIDEKNQQIGVVTTTEAIRRAEEARLDLVEISPTANPPVCKILDYGKFLFEKKKKEKEAKKKQKVSQLKEIKLTPKISTHDMDHKRNHIIEFLEGGDKVKISMRFRGRERMYLDRGVEILKNFLTTFSDLCEIEQEIKQEGATVSLCVAPKKNKPVIKEKLEKTNNEEVEKNAKTQD